MTFTSRQTLGVFALAGTLVLCGTNLSAAPQSARGLEKGQGHNRQYDRFTEANYQQGLRDGQRDRANNRQPQYRQRGNSRNNNVAQNRAYEAGYDDGYRANNGAYNNGRYNNDGYNNGGYNRNSATRPNFEQGLRDGQGDRANNRPHQYRERADPRNNNVAENRAYEAGYDQGFSGGNNGRYNGQYDPRARQNGQFGQGQYGQFNNAAARNGQQDGLFDGQKDRQTGHSNRPTQGDWYRSATRGYDSSLGDREQYKVAYRQSYLPAYQRGYTNQ